MVLEDSDDSENITVGSGMAENIWMHIWKWFREFSGKTGKFRKVLEGGNPLALGRVGPRAPGGRPAGLVDGWREAPPPSTRFGMGRGLSIPFQYGHSGNFHIEFEIE